MNIWTAFRTKNLTLSYTNLCVRWNQNFSNNSEFLNYSRLLSRSSPWATWCDRVLPTHSLLGRINNYAVQLRYHASSLLASVVTFLSDQLLFYERGKVFWGRKPFISWKINWREVPEVLKTLWDGWKKRKLQDDGDKFYSVEIRNLWVCPNVIRMIKTTGTFSKDEGYEIGLKHGW